MSLGEIVKSAHDRKSHTINVEVEVEDLEQVEEALNAGASILLLDNMDTEQMATAVQLCKGRAVTEASGGITFDNIRQVAASGDHVGHVKKPSESGLTWFDLRPSGDMVLILPSKST